MEEFVREVLSRYTSFVSERQLYERWLDTILFLNIFKKQENVL